MRTAVNPGMQLKRKAFIILYLISVMIGLQGQNSHYFINSSDIKSNEKAQADFRTEIFTDKPIVSDSLLASTEVDREVEQGSTYIDYYIKSISGIINELYECEELEDEMLIEGWMTEEFKVKSDLTDDTGIIEEKMELEEWMTDPSHWKSYAKK